MEMDNVEIVVDITVKHRKDWNTTITLAESQRKAGGAMALRNLSEKVRSMARDATAEVRATLEDRIESEEAKANESL